MDRLLYGAAYYSEYLPHDRTAEDTAMMTEAGHNVIRIAESTWSTLEPQPGVFDFTHVDRALEAAREAGLSVIVGTPTYAVPTWLVASHPEVLAETSRGPGRYGARQIMDITSPAYLFHAERMIRALLERTARHEHVIGSQVDNENKHHDTASRGAPRAFVKHQPGRPAARRAHGRGPARPPRPQRARDRLPGRQRDQAPRHGIARGAARLRQAPAGTLRRRSRRAQRRLRPGVLVQPHRRLGGLPGRARHHQRLARLRLGGVPPLARGRLPPLAERHRARVRARGPVRHPELRLRLDAGLVLRAAAGGGPLLRRAHRGPRRHRHLPPHAVPPDRQGDRLRRRHDPLPQGRGELPRARDPGAGA